MRALLEQGRRVRALVREDLRSLEGLDVELVKGDVRDPDSLRRLFAGADSVFHCAAIISIDGRDDPVHTEVNVGGPSNVAAACLEQGVKKLVHFSSIHALSEHPLDSPMDEDRPRASGPGELPYNRAKAAGEAEILAAVEKGLDAVILNPSGIVGPHDYKLSHMGEVLRDLATRRLPALVHGGYNFVDVNDVVQGALAAEKKGATGRRYILSGHYISVPELAELVEQITGVPRPRFTTPMWLARFGAPFVVGFSRLTGGRPKYTPASLKILTGNGKMSHDRATRELGFVPRPLRQTVAAALNWQVGAGLVPPFERKDAD